MTDKATSEALLLAAWFDDNTSIVGAKRIAAELRRQHARIAELEAQIEAVGAGGVQALSAGPAEVLGWIFEDELPENYPYSAMFPHSKVDTVRMFPVFAPQAASPTPQAEQPAQPGATPKAAATSEAAPVVQPGAVYAELPEPHYEHGDNPSMGEVNCDCNTADQVRDFADRTHALRQAAPKAAPGEQFDSEGFRAWVRKNLPDDTIIGSSSWWANHLTEWAQRFAMTAPQQGAQEPVAWRLRNTAFRSEVYEYFRTQYLAECRQKQFNASVDDGGLHDLTPLYTAPQPAAPQTAPPECHHRPPCAECVARTAHGGA